MADNHKRPGELEQLIAMLKAFPYFVKEFQNLQYCDEVIALARLMLLPSYYGAPDTDLVLVEPFGAGKCWHELPEASRRNYDQLMSYLGRQLAAEAKPDALRNPDYVGDPDLSPAYVRRALRMVQLHVRFMGPQLVQSRAGTVQRST